MATVRGNFAAELDPAVRTIFFDRYNEAKQVMPSIFNVLSSSKDQETDSATTGFGRMEETGELGALSYEDPLKMYNTVYRHLKYTKGFKVSQELLEDDQHNVISRLPRALAKSVVYTTEYWAASVFNNGFNTAYTSYGDGKPLFSTLHPRADGGSSQSNASATGIALTEPNLETGLVAFGNQLNDKGMITSSMVDKLIVPLALQKQAAILTKSEYKPGSANNDVNVYNGAMTPIVWKYLTSSTAWFLQDSGEHLLNWFWRIRPEFKSDMSFDNDASLHKVRIRFSFGWSDWRAMWGSKGDAAAYSS